MYFKDLGTSDIKYNFEQFKEFFNNHLEINSNNKKATLSLFYDCISEVIKGMSQEN
jgi:hypothetical protein